VVPRTPGSRQRPVRGSSPLRGRGAFSFPSATGTRSQMRRAQTYERWTALELKHCLIERKPKHTDCYRHEPNVIKQTLTAYQRDRAAKGCFKKGDSHHSPSAIAHPARRNAASIQNSLFYPTGEDRTLWAALDVPLGGHEQMTMTDVVRSGRGLGNRPHGERSDTQTMGECSGGTGGRLQSERESGNSRGSPGNWRTRIPCVCRRTHTSNFPKLGRAAGAVQRGHVLSVSVMATGFHCWCRDKNALVSAAGGCHGIATAWANEEAGQTAKTARGTTSWNGSATLRACHYDTSR
jgi:hypothetical protein